MALVACASSRTGEDTDAPVGPTIDAEPPLPDAPDLAEFGEPCTDRDQCESNLCILVGTSGQCTMLCGDCPDGYSCLGVVGIDIEGTVSFVCVPTSTQLCSPCTQDSECTLIGNDKCVPYADGDEYCGQDCSTVSCPTGFSCETVDIGGTDFDQCVAESGACDCTAANPGAMQPCNIITPWNVCLGSQTCEGASGWGACEPPSPSDDPDSSYTDSNCDGIDGDLTRGIFVALGGVNSGGCGLTYTDPCQSIAFGISRAQATGRPHVYVQSGTYPGPLAMANGISVFGGYNFNWQRAPYSNAGHTVTIAGGNPAVTFTSLTAPTWLDNVIVNSANAVGTGASTIGVRVTMSSNAELRGVLIDPGIGAPGADGNNGGVGAAGGNGGQGVPGCEDSGGFCSGCSRPPGGLSGSSSCGRPGGVGGQPGHGGGAGSAGGTGTIGTPGGPGAPCGGSSSCDGTVGGTGLPGGPGGHGIAGGAIGSFSGASYVTSNGGNGSTGGPGNGGGGGGGGGGGDTDCDSYGSSGGGGGGGGCGGGLGTAGTGGGGSFGVVALDSLLVITDSMVLGGIGGAGGDGGDGGPGGGGGAGGPGGPYGGGSEQDDGGDGAYGGPGGAGGPGGDGGGGGGGPSIAVVCLGSSSSTVSAIATALSGGTGGLGGTSLAPGAPGLSAATYGCPF
jgi:hypothetical protein